MAESDLAQAHPFRGRAQLTAVTGNRRTLRGPVDEELGLLRLDVRGRSPIDILSMAGHPVIVSEMEPTRLSADYPGAIAASLEQDGSRPLFLTGAAGGMSILFPEFEQSVDRHLSLVTGLLGRGVTLALDDLAPAGPGPLRAAVRDAPLGPVRIPRICPAQGVGWSACEALIGPVRALWRRLIEAAYRDVESAPVHGLFVGDTALIGFPADTGPTVTLRAREMARERGIAQVLPSSHCDSYIGYVHLPDDYLTPPGKGYAGLAIYENAMAFFGPDMGIRFLEALARLLEA